MGHLDDLEIGLVGFGVDPGAVVLHHLGPEDVGMGVAVDAALDRVIVAHGEGLVDRGQEGEDGTVGRALCGWGRVHTHTCGDDRC